MNIEIRELTPALLEDYLHFFDHDAFADFPWWSGCYCAFYHDPGNPTGIASPESGPEHRALKSELIRRGEANGLLAYSNGKPVGWCNAGPRAKYQNLRHYKVAVDDPQEPVGSIMCFVIAAPYRKQGIATALLDAACTMLRGLNLSIAEAYPPTAPPQGPYADQTPWSAHNYHGSLSMYLKAGFVVRRQMERFAIVRKTVAP